MAGITLEQAQTALNNALAAHAKVTTQGQSYEIHSGQGSRQLDRVRLDQLQADIDYWDAKVKTLTQSATGRGRARTMVVRS